MCVKHRNYINARRFREALYRLEGDPILEGLGNPCAFSQFLIFVSNFENRISFILGCPAESFTHDPCGCRKVRPSCSSLGTIP